jgi:hypothetical protein
VVVEDGVARLALFPGSRGGCCRDIGNLARTRIEARQVSRA